MDLVYWGYDEDSSSKRCDKVPYRTAEEARAAALASSLHYGSKDLRPYYCSECGAYHLYTHRED